MYPDILTLLWAAYQAAANHSNGYLFHRTTGGADSRPRYRGRQGLRPSYGGNDRIEVFLEQASSAPFKTRLACLHQILRDVLNINKIVDHTLKPKVAML